MGDGEMRASRVPGKRKWIFGAGVVVPAACDNPEGAATAVLDTVHHIVILA